MLSFSHFAPLSAIHLQYILKQHGTQLAAEWLCSYTNTGLLSACFILLLNCRPAAIMSLFVEDFLFEVYEVPMWQQILNASLQLTALSAQTDCM